MVREEGEREEQGLKNTFRSFDVASKEFPWLVNYKDRSVTDIEMSGVRFLSSSFLLLFPPLPLPSPLSPLSSPLSPLPSFRFPASTAFLSSSFS
jgi:hypothetical protein